MDDKIIGSNLLEYEFINRTPIPMWRWILLHFVKTHISFDVDVPITCVCYAKVLLGEVYIWKIKTYNSYNGKLIKTEKLTRRD